MCMYRLGSRIRSFNVLNCLRTYSICSFYNAILLKSCCNFTQISLQRLIDWNLFLVDLSLFNGTQATDDPTEKRAAHATRTGWNILFLQDYHNGIFGMLHGEVAT